jgi:hypothetical protein
MHAATLNQPRQRNLAPHIPRRREIGSTDQFIVVSAGHYLYEIEWVTGPRRGQRQGVNAGFLTKCEVAR